MAISEDAARLRQLSNESYAQGALQQAQEHMESAANAAQQAIGDAAGEDASQLNGLASHVRQALDSALEAVQLFYAGCGEIAGRHGG